MHVATCPNAMPGDDGQVSHAGIGIEAAADKPTDASASVKRHCRASYLRLHQPRVMSVTFNIQTD